MTKHSRFWLAHELRTRPLVPQYAEPDDFSGIVAVTACPFNCYLRGQPPDETNAAIARIAADYSEHYKVPLIGQWEHTNILRRMYLPVIEFQSEDGERVQSQRLIQWQARTLRMFAKNGKPPKVATVGMPEHLGRVVALQEYFGLNPKVVPESAHVPYDPWDRPGAQDWCKDREIFSKYEKPRTRILTAGKSFAMPWEFARSF
jgi:hypothetical protein